MTEGILASICESVENKLAARRPNKIWLKPHSHCAGVATVHPDPGHPVYCDAPGHIS